VLLLPELPLVYKKTIAKSERIKMRFKVSIDIAGNVSRAGLRCGEANCEVSAKIMLFVENKLPATQNQQ
jgi:hypothetical protein